MDVWYLCILNYLFLCDLALSFYMNRSVGLELLMELLEQAKLMEPPNKLVWVDVLPSWSLSRRELMVWIKKEQITDLLISKPLVCHFVVFIWANCMQMQLTLIWFLFWATYLQNWYLRCDILKHLDTWFTW